MQVLSQGVAAKIRDGFADYHARFAAITRRAKRRFETRDAAGMRADLIERIELYDVCVGQMQRWLEHVLGEHSQDGLLWSSIRDAYAQAVADLLDQELYKTFYNTLTRRFFRTQGVDPAIEFEAIGIEPTDRITHPAPRHVYAIGASLEDTCRLLLT